MDLRDYQQSAIQGLKDGIRTGHDKQILRADTGSGKTVMAASIIKGAESKGNRTIFMADSLELVEQAIATFDKWGLDVGVMQANHYRTDESCLTQVCTPQTLTGRIRKQYDKFQNYPVHLIIVDECHVQHSARDTLVELYPNARVIGLTATPYSNGLGDFYKNVVSAVPMAQLIDEGFLCDYKVFGPPSKPDMHGVGKDADGDWQKSQIELKYDKALVGDIYDHWLKHGKGKPTIGFCGTVAQSRMMSEMFQERGVNCAHIDGYGQSKEEKEQRIEANRAYKNGELEILWNCAVVVKGYDAPLTECLIIARPTMSRILHCQMLGRLLRPCPERGKEYGIVLDHAGNFDRLGYPEQYTDFSLNSGDKKESVEDRINNDNPPPCKCGNPSCSYSAPKFFSPCPECGFERTVTKTCKEVLISEGILVERKKDTGPSKDEMQEFYSGLLHIANEKKYDRPEGWAYHKFKEKFKTPPENLNRVATEPSKAVKGYMKYLAIRRAKGRKYAA